MASKVVIWVLVAPPLLLNLALYLINLGISGWVLNELIDNELRKGNHATPYLAITASASGVVGVASVLTGFYSLISRKAENNAAAAASGLIAWALTVLNLGFASKQIKIGHVHSKRLKALECISIILAGTQLLYVILSHTRLLLEKNPSATTTGGPTGKSLASQDTAAAV
ncbi:hypothetical protein O6H91_06G121600 [Diphasiastrum complanatum]|uniref:Uncharacterized protein n=1 Tax=Diphasiastrum complanatum TaxID=34168 RepID=A0ACC2DIH6_DIPCM|nr:hypothetical protein O6H91_Y201100 [Diphasiastrum complanatum]KAJ7553989.1 hypothetical protein O6H91_06G121600 [Diphasiastrum complanatum]